MLRPSLFRRLTAFMGWTSASYALVGVFLLTVFLIIYIWWPIAVQVLAYIDWGGQWWRYFDWLLVGIFLFMSLTIMSGADIRADALIIFVGALGGLVIESWGTQSGIWWYFTAQRPPLWIIPAWPIASLTIDRMVRALILFTTKYTKGTKEKKQSPLCSIVSACPRSLGVVLNFKTLYWLVFPAFYALMLFFVWPAMGKSMTVMAVLLVTFLILTPTDHRFAVLTFLAGAGLGYFLEYWGTTRECWTYYTLQKPPLFAMLAHGMAAVAFWRAGEVVEMVWGKFC
ncbi:MAG: hypothetical protein QMD04_04855 [Anaerolineales bacterium]|nr:hypothetical protein [Anaerolineales bacterium]